MAYPDLEDNYFAAENWTRFDDCSSRVHKLLRKEDRVNAVEEEEPEDDTWKFAPLPLPEDGDRYSVGQLQTMSIHQLNRVRRTTNTKIPDDLMIKAALAWVDWQPSGACDR